MLHYVKLIQVKEKYTDFQPEKFEEVWYVGLLGLGHKVFRVRNSSTFTHV